MKEIVIVKFFIWGLALVQEILFLDLVLLFQKDEEGRGYHLQLCLHTPRKNSLLQWFR